MKLGYLSCENQTFSQRNRIHITGLPQCVLFNQNGFLRDWIQRKAHPTFANSMFSMCSLPISCCDIFKTNPHIYSHLYRNNLMFREMLVDLVNLCSAWQSQLRCQAPAAAFRRVEGGINCIFAAADCRGWDALRCRSTNKALAAIGHI